MHAEERERKTYPCTTWDWMDRTRAGLGGMPGPTFPVVVVVVVVVVVLVVVVVILKVG